VDDAHSPNPEAKARAEACLKELDELEGTCVTAGEHL
jgi:hypothetical protein